MWYREGTITFTQGSNTLVGVGTAWNVTANGVLPGMIVIGPDNKLYEIKRVTSDTNIVLSEPYTGETQSEVPCRIITTYEGDLTQFSARFTALMSRMSADSKSMRSWLTALDEVTIEREDGTEVTVKPLMQIVNEHNENVEWYKNNTDAIDAAGDKAREAAASAAAAAESANTAGEKASQASQSAQAAASSQSAASASESASRVSETNAELAKEAAAQSEAIASSAAAAANEKAIEATNQATTAKNYALEAKSSELNAKASEDNAASSMAAAAESASSASSSESSASASKDEAARQASEAAGSAVIASTKATEAAGSATAASQSKTAAESAATRAEAAADRAEEIADAVAMEDASLTTKGVVKLSSAVDSTSESLAATPKAVKAANDNANSRVPSNRKVNGKALTADITLTPKDIGTLNSVTMSFSGGAGWFKLATVTMPQASSIVYITLIGGAGYNVGSPHQAGISELVLRAGNGNPKGITGALWKRTAVGLTNFAWINTSGDTYDIYVEIGNYATSVNIHWDCTANASVSIYTSPTYSASKPSSVTDGVVYTMYSSHQKPTPSDIGALPTTGGTVSGPLSVTGGLTGSLNGNASTATKLQTARTIGGVAFDGSANINLPGVNTAGNQSTTGNAATATKLQTARTIGGVSFNGTANIDLPGVNKAGNQSTTGNAATATKLQTARTIGGVSFDGTANINLPGVNAAGNQNTTGNAATATKLQTARTINGVSFNGSANISIPTITSRGRVTALTGTTQGAATGLQMYEAYNNGYPSDYGNVLHLKGATAVGEGELFIGWSGTSGAHAPVHVRSRRDTDTASWSEWAQVYTSKDSIPGVNATGNQNTTGNAASATKLQTARTIGGVSFNGTANINLPGVNIAGNQNTTGNAASATKLQTARTIGGVSFNGTANINLPGVNIAGNQNTTGNAATATKLQTARKIAGVAFDGSADITLTATNVNAYTKTEVTNLLSSYVKSTALPSMTVRTSSVSGGDMGMSLSAFISHLRSNGAFSKSYWIGFGDAMGFNAGSINNITGFGAVELAESIIEVFNLPNGDYTIRLTTSHKADYGGVTNAILVYHYRSNRSPSGQWLKFAGTVGATSN
ncbi:tail fiber protein [Escherichia coli]|uniref:tail fiber protein n=1 Tax=Escherichia coli TaxID=562 RepID=UPI003F81F4BB